MQRQQFENSKLLLRMKLKKMLYEVYGLFNYPESEKYNLWNVHLEYLQLS